MAEPWLDMFSRLKRYDNPAEYLDCAYQSRARLVHCPNARGRSAR